MASEIEGFFCTFCAVALPEPHAEWCRSDKCNFRPRSELEAHRQYRKAMADVNRMNDRGELPT
jgi:hypothetical protein